MLLTLRIQNFALIDEIELKFDSGYTVITGETGSGKSILLNALNLILGERSDFSVIGHASDKAIVEAEFQIEDFHLEEFFNENDLDLENITIIRREISTNGKSRAFINDTPVSLNILKSLTSTLINIHSQYNTLELKNKSYQLEVLDVLAELKTKRKSYVAKFKKYNDNRSNLAELKFALSQAIQLQDYNKFQLTELEELNLDQTNYEFLEVELKKVENGEELLQALASIISTLDDENQVVDKLHALRSVLDKTKHIDNTIQNLAERIQSVLIELSDISSDATRLIDSVEIDPEKMQLLSHSLNRYNHALKKHNVVNQQELMELKTNLEGEVLNVEETQNLIIKLEGELDLLEKEIYTEANLLHQDRLNASLHVSEELQAILEELKLPNTKLEFQLIKRTEINQYGLTDLTILFSANKGIETIPIEKAASGGELSRVMLALQKMISEKKLLPTVLFDEIDTGVSGEVAQKMGTLLHKMGANFQLIAISHLPQVAAKASIHLKVEKEVKGDRTSTTVKVLTEMERINEIARLMSGENISEAAKETAKSLMQ